jgi:hypothetical protein
MTREEATLLQPGSAVYINYDFQLKKDQRFGTVISVTLRNPLYSESGPSVLVRVPDGRVLEYHSIWIYFPWQECPPPNKLPRGFYPIHYRESITRKLYGDTSPNNNPCIQKDHMLFRILVPASSSMTFERFQRSTLAKGKTFVDESELERVIRGIPAYCGSWFQTLDDEMKLFLRHAWNDHKFPKAVV